MNFDLISDPFVSALTFFVLVPPILAVILMVGPLRRLLQGVFLGALALPLILSAVSIVVVILFMLTADLIFKSKSVETLIFGSDFSHFQDELTSNTVASLDAQFGPFNYFGLLENPCVLDYYAEQELSQISNLLLGGFHKVACYSDWKIGNHQIENSKHLIEDLLNENLSSVRSDLSVDVLSERTLLDLPKLVTVNKKNGCTANAVYNVKTVLNGKLIGISITDYYNFEQMDYLQPKRFAASGGISKYSCQNHCFTRRLNLDLSNVTTPLRYSQFAESHFSDDVVDKSNVAVTEEDRRLFYMANMKQKKDLLASERFQKWLYSRDKQAEVNLPELLAQSEIDFERISEGTSRTWIERTWEHPYLFGGEVYYKLFRPEWESNQSTFDVRIKSSSALFFRDDEIYFLTKNKALIDEVKQNCSEQATDWSKLALPPTDTGDLALVGGFGEPLNIKITADGTVFISDQKISRDKLYEKLSNISAYSQNMPIILSADGSLPFNIIEEMLHIIKTAGFSDVSITPLVKSSDNVIIIDEPWED